mgnify:CR=1 FL=1
MKDLRVVFMGTPDFAVPVLEKLILNTKVVLVVSQPDKCVGRKRELVPTPIKKKALELLESGTVTRVLAWSRSEDFIYEVNRRR